MKIYGVETHPAADWFPMMGEEELESLAADIQVNGQLNAVVTFKGRILDGRNRMAACEMIGCEPFTEEWDGEGDPVVWVISQNLHRRHLKESQRAVIGARLKEHFEEAARKRQEATRAKAGREGRDTSGRISPTPATANLREPADVHRHERTASADAATAVSVSSRSVEDGAKLLKHGAPELVAAVEKGSVAVSAAAKVATLPHAEQAKLVAAGKNAVAEKAKEIRLQKDAPKPLAANPKAKEAFEHLWRVNEVADAIRKADAMWLALAKEGLLETVGFHRDSIHNNLNSALAMIEQSVKPIAECSCCGTNAQCKTCGGRGWVNRKEAQQYSIPIDKA